MTHNGLLSLNQFMDKLEFLIFAMLGITISAFVVVAIVVIAMDNKKK